MSGPTPTQLDVATLGPGRHPSPLRSRRARFVEEQERVLLHQRTDQLVTEVSGNALVPAFESAGPRRDLFFDPAAIGCGIVTCGGLCPGLNNVIRSLVLTLTYGYGTRHIVGFPYGYAGLSRQAPAPPRRLTPELVESIHESGGTLLGSSRGPQDVGEMVDTLVAEQVSLLFAIGGDGTLRGVQALCDEVARRRLPIAVVGVPKTIDNDLEWTERSFGFVTAVEEAGRVVAAAHAEARGAWNGVGLVKLMGRYAGFIAAHATLGNADVNFCLVPEVPFDLDGDAGFLAALERRLSEKHHAVVVVAEGAGQRLIDSAGQKGRDASGNQRLGDIGVHLRDRIVQRFGERSFPVVVRYIDPSYTIRGAPANMFDAEFCLRLGQHAVHAGMAGRTNVMIGYWSQHFTHVPIALAVGGRRQIAADGGLWQSVLETTGQPTVMSTNPRR